MTWIKKYFYLIPVTFYVPSLWNFFSGDDWFHLRISQIGTLQEFLNFFSFNANAQTASFYRPLSTQVFFYTFQRLFDLNTGWYYLFGLVLFGYSLYLVKKFSGSSLAALIYGVSVSNFTRIYFLSAYQELFLVIFSLLALINFKSKPKLSLLFFLLALMSKETAIILPALIILMSYKDTKLTHTTYYLLLATISGIYLYFRLFHFGLAAGDSYLWDFSPVRAVNTLMWYLLWSFGAPELLVDYVGSGLRLIPRFFADYQYWWSIIIFPLLGIILGCIYLAIKNFPKLKHILFFIIALLPVLFLPSHKFTLELGLPLVAFSMIVAKLYEKKYLLLSIFIAYNLAMNILTYTRHYSVSRGQIAKKVFNFLNKEYTQYPTGQEFLFINDAEDYGDIWGQSKQISQAISGSDMFKTIYSDQSIKVFYQDLDRDYAKNQGTIEISTAKFLNQ